MSTKAAAKKAPSRTKPSSAKTAARKPKASWAETMKKALEKKQPPGGFPDQPKPRDSAQKIRKNAY
ncbi:hypothetical protein JM946_11490 [Steroidobacter sp. S1-65]|uniref:Uncharacterized protein n=1 Tax=Steroidobacter gossypii TaxID=2805490 RepID=A0ABS1WWQ4_9GAMM|nr:hypothetical protein [Steroidobacter gossypii]MBM0105377.1 hypothetical protein [Steroidobacter gossypii]